MRRVRLFSVFPFWLLMTAPLLAESIEDFEVIDTNATSPRAGETVSPRDCRHQVSAYYFGAAT